MRATDDEQAVKVFAMNSLFIGNDERAIESN